MSLGTYELLLYSEATFPVAFDMRIVENPFIDIHQTYFSITSDHFFVYISDPKLLSIASCLQDSAIGDSVYYSTIGNYVKCPLAQL